MWVYLRGHELGRTTERARRLAEPHLLLAQTVISDLDVSLHGQQDVIQLQVAICVQVLSVNGLHRLEDRYRTYR